MTGQLDGGRVAARGLQYQYLRTLEAMLDLIDDATVAAVRVEGPADRQPADEVDFDVVGTAGQCFLAAQVKSVLPGGSVSAASAFGQLAKLTSKHDACRYNLLMNAIPEPSALNLQAALASANGPGELQAALGSVLSKARTRQHQLGKLSAEQLERMVRARILFDSRDLVELRESLRERLRAYRNRMRDGLGMQSAGQAWRIEDEPGRVIMRGGQWVLGLSSPLSATSLTATCLPQKPSSPSRRHRSGPETPSTAIPASGGQQTHLECAGI